MTDAAHEVPPGPAADPERALLLALDENERIRFALKIAIHGVRRLKACKAENVRLRQALEAIATLADARRGPLVECACGRVAHDALEAAP